MKVSVARVNAFTDEGIGGNPAGVVIDADQLTAAEKQAIARAAGLSETAFVSTSTCATVKLDFFTPTRQIAHCGHATIATFRYLFELGRLDAGEHSKETIDGVRRVVLTQDQAYMEQTAPNYAPLDNQLPRILQSLNVQAEQLVAPPLRVDTGNGFVVLGVDSATTLAKLAPDFEAINALSEELNLVGFYVFVATPKDPARQASSRMFAPRFGIQEEAATGMAAGPLACYLSQQLGYTQSRFAIAQGHFMTPAAPSVIHVELARPAEKILSLMAGGAAQFAAEIALEI